MSDKLKRYPDNVEPLHSRFIPSPYDDDDKGEEKLNK